MQLYLYTLLELDVFPNRLLPSIENGKKSNVDCYFTIFLRTI